MPREQQVYFRVTDQIHERMVYQAKRRGVSIPDLVRFMVADRLSYMEREENEENAERARDRVGKAVGG